MAILEGMKRVFSRSFDLYCFFFSIVAWPPEVSVVHSCLFALFCSCPEDSLFTRRGKY